MSGTILVVDDRRATRRALGLELEDAGWRVVEARDGLEGVDRFERESPDLVLARLELPLCDGTALVARIRRASDAPVVLFTAETNLAEVVAAVKCGADDVVTCEDVDVEELLTRAERRSPAPPGGSADFEAALPGRSDAVVRARDRLRALAPLDAPILLHGEPGVGFGRAARMVHRASRPSAAFRTLEGATLERWPELVRHGTAFVRDVDALAPSLQEEWLRLLSKPESTVRWIGACRPLGDERLLPELRTRLARFRVRLPTLRERPEDVPRVARRIAEEVAGRLGRERRISPAALDRLRAVPWPGNTVELAAVLERSIAFSPSVEVDVSTVNEVLAEVRLSVEGLRDAKQNDEREALLAALEACGGNVTQVARRLGRSRAAVYRMVERHGVPLRRDA